MRDSSKQTSITLLVLLVILMALAMGCSSARDASAPATPVPEQTAVNEDEGTLYDSEKRLLNVLEDKGIMVPDSIVVVEDTVTHGYVKHMEAPQTVHLTTVRSEYPQAEIPLQFPYLYARTGKPSAEIFHAYVLAHELAHIQGPRLKAEMGRPALGVSTKTSEVQADILALVLLNEAFGLTYEDLGYPAQVEYPHIPNQTVAALQRKYCVIVKKTWDVQTMDCYNQ